METRVDALFARPVQATVVDGAAEINRGILDSLSDYPELAAGAKPMKFFCNVATTFTERAQVLVDPPFAALLPQIVRAIVDFAGVLGWDAEGHDPSLFESWLNVYEGGSYQEVHQHPMSLMSGVYYVEATEGSGSIFFQAPEPTMLQPVRTGTNQFPQGVVTYDPMPGSLILFGSEMRHGVQPSAPSSRRVSIAFNISQQPKAS